MLPLAIALIMVAMGMSLVVDDFRRLLSEPKAVLTGLACQLVALPALGFAVAARGVEVSGSDGFGERRTLETVELVPLVAATCSSERTLAGKAPWTLPIPNR